MNGYEVCMCIYTYMCVCIHTYIYIHTYISTHTHTHTHTMEQYSAIKMNEIMPFVATWMDMWEDGL